MGDTRDIFESPSCAYQTRQLAVCLSVFFSLHDRTMLDTVDRIARGFVYRQKYLDDALKCVYGYDLYGVPAKRPTAQERRGRRERRDEVHDLSVRLCLFFSIHQPSMIAHIGLIARSFAHDDRDLNEALMRRYGCNVEC